MVRVLAAGDKLGTRCWLRKPWLTGLTECLILKRLAWPAAAMLSALYYFFYVSLASSLLKYTGQRSSLFSDYLSASLPNQWIAAPCVIPFTDIKCNRLHVSPFYCLLLNSFIYIYLCLPICLTGFFFSLYVSLCSLPSGTENPLVPPTWECPQRQICLFNISFSLQYAPGS